MIRSIHINGYRAFDRFEIGSLGRVNLLVGSNNSGKTSLLEAIYLLTSRGDPWALWTILNRRGERSAQADVDIGHLFHGHELRLGSKFSLLARNQTPERRVEFSVAEISRKEQREELGTLEDDSPVQSRLVLRIQGFPSPVVHTVPLSRTGSISPDNFNAPASIRRRVSLTSDPTHFITAESSTPEEMISLWDNIALRPEEGLVLRALQFLEPRIERITAQATHVTGRGPFYAQRTRGGFIVKLTQYEQPIPIGSMGDGMWRMLAMAIAISQCKGGVLLVDEIDSGLHYTVLSKMWTLIYSAARDFDVQVFATTHSSDCVRSLATLCVDRGDAVSLQRIEAGRCKSIPYTEEEILAAAERNVEVR